LVPGVAVLLAEVTDDLEFKRDEVQRSIDSEVQRVRSSIESAYKQSQLRQQKLQEEMNRRDSGSSASAN